MFLDFLRTVVYLARSVKYSFTAVKSWSINVIRNHLKKSLNYLAQKSFKIFDQIYWRKHSNQANVRAKNYVQWKFYHMNLRQKLAIVWKSYKNTCTVHWDVMLLIRFIFFIFSEFSQSRLEHVLCWRTNEMYESKTQLIELTRKCICWSI